MSAPMKKHRISEKSSEVDIVVHEGGVKTFRVPKDKAKGLVLLLNEFRIKVSSGAEASTSAIPADEIFKELDEKFGRAGAALQGARLKEGLTQVELAQKLRINQADLSKMEHGKRSIGKRMARKLAHALNVDYRIFL